MANLRTSTPSEADDDRPQSEMSVNPERAPVRALLWLLAGLLVAVGLLSSWFFCRMEASYSQILDQTIRDLKNVQELALHSEVTDADILELAITRDPAKRSEIVRLIAEEQAANDKVCSELQHETASLRIQGFLEQVLTNKVRLEKEVNAIAQASEQGDGKSSDAAPLRRVIEEFIGYQKSCHDLADQVAARSKELNSQLNRKLDHLRLCFFILGVAPIGCALLLLLGIFYLVRNTPIEMDLS
jgi:hypothetical protein